MATLLLSPAVMQPFVTFSRRFFTAFAAAAVLFLVTGRAEAQGIGFQGGATVDPEQGFIGTHFETGELYRNLRFRPGIDGGFGDGFSLATLNIEFLHHIPVGSTWSIYQGGGPAVVFLRVNDETSTHAGAFYTFGFAHEGGFFTDFKIGTGNAPRLKFGVGYTVRKRNP